MQQVIQSYRSGEVSVREVPAPGCPTNGILVRNRASLISIGTERSIVELGRKSLLGKARARPDLAKRALDKAKKEGFWKVFKESLAKLDTPTPLGYSSAGVVLEVGAGVHEFSPGDRVACVGVGFGSHAEIVAVPVNMACKIPEGLGFEEAAFGMVGPIALHGVREANLSFGSIVAVMGLGLLGLISVQLLNAYGCRVIAMDVDPSKLELARKFGAKHAVSSSEALIELVNAETGGLGADAVIIAAATKSSDPINTAVALSRHKARIVLVGVADIHPDRNEMWHKEVEIVVSKAGGAGALDPLYELDGIDIPIAYARWTQNRNVEEFLRLAAERRIDLGAIITHRYPIADADAVYARIMDGKLPGSIGVVLDYPDDGPVVRRVSLTQARPQVNPGTPRVAVLGAGSFGGSVILPALARAKGLERKILATSSGATAEHNARRFMFAECATDGDAVFAREDIDAVFALTPHSHHARAAILAAHHNKALFIEKPLCTTPEELADVEAAYAQSASLLMIGHNRRYSPHGRKIREWLAGRTGPMVMDMRINAGFVPKHHWVHSERQGRSRIIGEMTHFLDFAEAVAGVPLTELSAMRVGGDDLTVLNNDNIVVNFRFADGSIGSLVYSAQGSRGYPREHFEFFSGGKSIVSTDFVRTVLHGPSRDESFKTPAQAYGYPEEIQHYLAVTRGEEQPEVDLETNFRIMRAAFAIETSLAKGTAISLS
jgi:predicted dehydrogenase